MYLSIPSDFFPASVYTFNFFRNNWDYVKEREKERENILVAFAPFLNEKSDIVSKGSFSVMSSWMQERKKERPKKKET